MNCFFLLQIIFFKKKSWYFAALVFEHKICMYYDSWRLVDVMQSCGMTSLFQTWERYKTYQEDIISLPQNVFLLIGSTVILLLCGI
jgi:hypothetical protein